MLHSNCTITVYNHAVVNHRDVWIRTVIPGCSARVKTKTELLDSGLKSAASAVIRIPVFSPEKDYSPAAEWPKNSETWTLQKSDLILIGTGDELTSGIETLKDRHGADNVFVINGYADNRRGSLYLQHWRIDAS